MCQVRFTLVSMLNKDSRFYIEVDMFFVCRSVAVDASLQFVPVLYDEIHRQELPLVLVTGANRYKAIRQMMRSLPQCSIFHGYNLRRILKGVNPSQINYLYRVCIDYEDWMSEAEIHLLSPA